MKIAEKFSVLFRKYPLFRTCSIIFAILFVLGFVSIITYQARKIPQIDSIVPSVGSPGDVMVIAGRNFGSLKNSSDFVEVGGSRITASGYLEWTDEHIKLILPSNVQDGLVIVSTKAGQSKPGFFANEAGIPVEVPPDTKTTMPVISSVSPESAFVGQLLVLSGTNFGTVRSNSKIFFTANLPENSTSSDDIAFIEAAGEDYDYEYWSDSEIHVRVPNGAASGHIYVQTEKGTSNYAGVNLKSTLGTKKYSDKKTYLIHLNTDIDDINSKSNTTLSLHVPRPVKNSRQPFVQMTECAPEPVFENYQDTVIHQTELSKTSSKKLTFTHNFVVEDYAVQTKVNVKNVKPFAAKSRVLYTAFTKPDEVIASEDEDFIGLAKKIVKKETNPYLQAKIIYEYMLENFAVTKKLRKPGSEVKDLLEDKKGDSYDFAIVYTTLLRALKIPCLPVAGILVDSDMRAFSHWWSEFYIENFGWIPVDIALGSGLEYKSFKNVEDPKTFYFGNIDSQHIIFSRGYNEVKPTLSGGHIVSRDRTFAVQSIWEESSAGTVNYSSLWNEPVIAGVY